jgi:hypothetical protein
VRDVDIESVRDVTFPDLTALADDANVRFPAEPEAETTPLPELPPPPVPPAGTPGD